MKRRQSVFALVGYLLLACASPQAPAITRAPSPLPKPVSEESDPALRVPCEVTVRRAAEVGHRIYRSAEVDVPANMIFENKGPKRPRTRESAIVQAEFVVDTVGRADLTTFRPTRPVVAAFLLSVRDYLPSAKYTPARVGGHAVPQCVIQSFEFTEAGR